MGISSGGVEDDDTLRVDVLQQRSGTFSDFEGYDGEQAPAVRSQHDNWGVDEG